LRQVAKLSHFFPSHERKCSALPSCNFTPPCDNGDDQDHRMGQNLRYKELQLPQLRSFCLAATEGNFTTAARALGLSASTVWQQVRALERHLRARLLTRRGRAVELTDDGRRLLKLVGPHVNALDSLSRLFESRREELPQQLVVASGAYLHAHHLPGPVRAFRAEWPSVTVHLRVAAWSALHRLIDRGEADLAVLACDPDQPRSSSLEYERLFDEQLTLMLPDGHPLTRKKRISPQELVEHPLVLPPRGGADRKVIDRLFQQHNLFDRVRPAVVSGLIDVTSQYVVAGAGIALMYLAEETGRNMPGLQMRMLAAPIERLSIEMAVRKGAHLPEYVEAFRRIVRQCLAQ
jgi:DNA-binding transcriptional LysR family regulator